MAAPDPLAPPPSAPARTSLADTAVSGERASAAPGLARGTAVGRYLVLELVGEGGMGAVYAAYDPELNRKVALKLLKVDSAGAEVARARLLREAQAMARLNHPNAVTVYDAGFYGEQVFLAMELVDGQTLAQWLASSERSVRQIVDAFATAGEGLAAAHAAGLVHRDFKPQNVLVDRLGRVRVTDFGLARVEPRDAGEGSVARAVAPRTSVEVTVGGTVAGTPAYMAPEQFVGNPTDARTDQFSLCAALFEALAGRLPFAGNDFESLRASVLLGAPDLSALPKAVPAHLRQVLARGLSRQPADRFPSLADLLRELRRDPAAKVRRAAARAVSVFLAVGLVGASGAWLYRQQTLCGREARAAVQRRWSPARREGVSANLRAAGLAPEALAATLAALDADARAWGVAQEQACRAQRAGAQNAEELRCLGRSELRAEGVVSRLERPSPDLGGVTRRLLLQLLAPAECVERSRRPRRIASDLRTEQQRLVVEVQLALESGQHADVLQRTAETVPRFEAEGAWAEAAALLELRSMALGSRGEVEESVRVLREAVRDADRSGDDEASLSARARLASALAVNLFRGAEATEAALDAQAWLERTGSPRRLAIDVELAFCNAYSARVEPQLKKEALPHCAKMAELTGELYGVDQLGDALNDYAAALEVAGERTRAAAEYRRALELYERDPFKQPVHAAATWGNLAIVQSNLGRSSEALQAVGEARKLLRSVGEEPGAYAAWLGLVEGEALEDLGRLEEAGVTYAAALAALTGDDEMLRAEIRAGQARVLVRQGRAKEALPLAKEAAKTASGHPDVYPRVFCDMALAMALWETGEDRNSALGIARQSLALLQGAEDAFRRGWIERWLAEKAGPSPR
ncbi:MAG: serine/threonine-protein kinase [Myxococcales bacterium]